jgi:protein SCO1/2
MMRARLGTAVLAALLTIAPGGAVFASATPQLVDQTGRTFTLSSLRGRPLVVTFVSAHCADACPLIDAQFASAARRIATRHLNARLLTITLDPQHDPPSLMRALASRFEADPRYWLVAGGKVADVEQIVHAFGVIAQTGKDGYREAHTTFVYVFDANLNLNKTMLASTSLDDDVVAAVAPLAVAAR